MDATPDLLIFLNFRREPFLPHPFQFISPTFRHCMVPILINRKELEIPSLGTRNYLQVFTRYCSSFLIPIFVIYCHLDLPRGRFVKSLLGQKFSTKLHKKAWGREGVEVKKRKLGVRVLQYTKDLN
jgi:hypothetical protein